MRPLPTLLLAAIFAAAPALHAQASALPSAAPASANTPDRAKTLLTQMWQAVGGEAWHNRGQTFLEGHSATFYKGKPNPYEAQFEEYLRFHPQFGERVVVVSKQGIFIPTSKRDVAEVWTPTGGFEITYRGTRPLPEKDVAEFQRRRLHSLETILEDWLPNPETILTDEGSGMEERRPADRIGILAPSNDSVTLALDASTHLPLSLTVVWRDPVYKDLNTDIDRFDNWQPQEGIPTPLTTTHYHNGDIVAQRFLTRVHYHQQLPEALFDPTKPLMKK